MTDQSKLESVRKSMGLIPSIKSDALTCPVLSIEYLADCVLHMGQVIEQLLLEKGEHHAN